MSLAQSIRAQKNLEGIKKRIACQFADEYISDVILLEYPKWSICYKDGSHFDSYEVDACTQRSIYKLLQEEYT